MSCAYCVFPHSFGRHMSPSNFVQVTRVYLAWCPVVECDHCHMLAKYEDASPADPCPECGHKLIEKVGRWQWYSKPWWKFWTPRTGRWIMLQVPRPASRDYDPRSPGML